MELLVEGFEYLVVVFDVEMEVLLFAFEGAVALGLLLFIVLWTGKGKK